MLLLTATAFAWPLCLQRAIAATVFVHAWERAGGLVMEDHGVRGTGVCVARQGLPGDRPTIEVLTAAHVIQDEFTQEPADGLGCSFTVDDQDIPAVLLRYDTFLDLALLQVLGAPEQTDCVPLALHPVQPGDPVTVIGHPMTIPFAVLEGRVATGPIEAQNGRHVVFLQCPSGPGESGAGVFNRAGELVGLVRVGPIPSIAGIVLLEDIRQFLGRN